MEYLALEDGSPTFPQSCMFRGTQVRSSTKRVFHVRGYHPILPRFPSRSIRCFRFEWRRQFLRDRPITPTTQRTAAYTLLVWAVSVSLATTQEIVVTFCSCSY